MKQIILFFMTICLLLSGCMGDRYTGPWIETDFTGPWCGPGDITEVAMRQFDNQFKGLQKDVFLRHSDMQRPLLIYKFGLYFSFDVFTKTSFWQKWPGADSGSGNFFSWTDREILDKKAPFRFYLVSISPTVLVGISNKDDLFKIPKEGVFHPLSIKFYGLSYYERIWIMTQLSASPGADLVYFAPELSMELEKLNLDSGSAAISLPDGSHLTVSQEGTSISIIREN